MQPLIRALVATAVNLVRSRLSLQLEILALRHQLMVYQRSILRPRVRRSDRIFWSWLSRIWPRWREAVVFVQPGDRHRVAAPAFSGPLGPRQSDRIRWPTGDQQGAP